MTYFRLCGSVAWCEKQFSSLQGIPATLHGRLTDAPMLLRRKTPFFFACGSQAPHVACCHQDTVDFSVFRHRGRSWWCQ